MVNKNQCKKLSLFFLLFLLAACAVPKPAPAPDPYQIVYPNKLMADLPPAPGWRFADNSRDLKLFNPGLVNIYLKKDTGAIILVRSGREVDFGSSPSYDLTRAQLVYLIKMLPGGDFIGRQDFESKNPLLQRAKSIIRFKVRHPRLGPGQITAVLVKRGDLLLAELFAPQDSIARDEAEFFTFLDSLRERKENE